ncbi:MAG: hypothetical protein ACREKR_02955 [Candidatus Methylomirabilales bacterium]
MGVRFILQVEVSNVYHEGGRLRKIHTLLYAPSLEAAGRLNAAFARRIVFDVSPDSVIVPAHAWTPWFSIFGSQSGFDSLQETGLSSDPSMNWRLSALDGITLMSNSDAHSPSRLGRECNVFGRSRWKKSLPRR